MADNLSSSLRPVDITVLLNFLEKWKDVFTSIQSSNKESEKEQHDAAGEFMAALTLLKIDRKGRDHSALPPSIQLRKLEELERTQKTKAREDEQMLLEKQKQMSEELNKLFGSKTACTCSREMDDLAPLPSHPQKRKADSFSSDTSQGAKRIKLDTLLNPFPGDGPHSGQIGIPSFPITQSSPSATEQRRDSVTDLGDSIRPGAAHENTPIPDDCQGSQLPNWFGEQELDDDLFDKFLAVPDDGDEVTDWPCYTDTGDLPLPEHTPSERPVSKS